MRRWLCVLLLVLLPFQFSWAAVVGYCAHEADASSTHSGHHQHEHPRADGSSKTTGDVTATDTAKTMAPAIDLDCGHCHGLCVVVSVLPDEPPTLQAPGQAAPWSKRREASHPSAPPDRPQWSALA